MLRIRRMRTQDIPFAIRLSDQEKWGTTRSDFIRLLRLTPSGCFVAYDGAKRVGLTTVTKYGNIVGWIGNVVVDKPHRGKYIGQKLVDHAVGYLKGARVRCIALYCFNENVRFYQRLGFVTDARFMRMHRKARPRNRPPGVTHQARPDVPRLKNVLQADRSVFGADRSQLLRDVLARRAGWYIGSTHVSRDLSYLFVREYGDMCEIGPWVCIDPPRDEPEELLNNALEEIGQLPVEASCLRMNTRVVLLMKRTGFRTLKEGRRMFFETQCELGDDRAQYALGFQDKG